MMAPLHVRGRGLTWIQAIVLFVLVVTIMIVLSARTEHQSSQIRATNMALAKSNYESCLSAVIILQRFNDQQDALIVVEQDLADSPDATPAGRRAAKARVEAYRGARVEPLPVCNR